MVRLSYGALSLCGLLLLFAGCRGALEPWQKPPPSPEQVLSITERVWRHLAVRRRAFHNLKGLAKVRLDTATQSVGMDDTVVVLQRFDTMRLEGIGPFGQPVFLLISDGQRFSLYTPQERRLISGPASARNLARLFGMELAPNTLQYILVGDIPLATLPAEGTFSYLPRDDLYVWEGQNAQSLQDYRVWFEPHQLQPVRFEVENLFGEIMLRVDYEDFHQLDTFTLPYRMTIVQPLAERHVVWHYSEVRLNTDVTPAMFRLQVPPGTERVELE